MTDYTAIYEAGESLAELLRSKMTPEPIIKRENIGLCEPHSPEDFQLTIWIYNIEMVKGTGERTGYQPDADNPAQERFAPMEIKLGVLISAHSKAPAISKSADEYRILGKAMQTINDTPRLPREFVVGSLAEQSESVLLEIKSLSSEEIARVWNNNSKTIRPSFAVEMSKVFIGSNRVRDIAPRVTTAEFDTKAAFRKGR